MEVTPESQRAPSDTERIKLKEIRVSLRLCGKMIMFN